MSINTEEREEEEEEKNSRDINIQSKKKSMQPVQAQL